MASSEIVIPSVLHADTRLGYVHLTVSNLERALVYYQRALGFSLHRHGDGVAELGAGRETLLMLTENVNARRVRGTTGLYHFAILTPSRRALAKSLKNLIDTKTRIDGASDHLVSEALYLSDPDGNGIEIYRDRPRAEWTYGNGELKMDSLPFDFDGVLAELNGVDEGWTGLHPDTILGHMHLHVAHLAESVQFYRDVIGFALMTQWRGSAAFLSAGGYHHHLGINVWAGVGAPPPPADAVGLREWVVVLPNESEREKLIARLNAAGVPFNDRPDGLWARDSSQNTMRFVVQ